MHYILLGTLCLITIFRIPSHIALLIGLIAGLFAPLKTEDRAWAKKWGGRILFASVALLGASLSLQSMGRNSLEQAPLTALTIFITFALGHVLSKVFSLDREQGLLMTAGTAVCGGSAMAAVAPVINASAITMAVSMSVVFILNAVAVYIFPPIGHWLQLTQEQFGIWSALAIHDTSSVLAAAGLYGEEALKIATVTKLTRSLWIVPICLILSVAYKSHGQKAKPPWVIVTFLVVSALFTFIPALTPLRPHAQLMAKAGFSATLFLIGLQMDRENLRKVGWRPMGFGISLWIAMSAIGLWLVK